MLFRSRIGSLTAGYIPSATCDTPRVNQGKMQGIAFRILPTAIVVSARAVGTLPDRQEGCSNYDVLVELNQIVPMVFPMTGFVLADQGRRARLLRARVRMPIERPLFK